jgi:hypothetical protein
MRGGRGANEWSGIVTDAELASFEYLANADSISSLRVVQRLAPLLVTALRDARQERAQIAAGLKCWSIEAALAPSSPFEYDQGDHVIVHYDDLYDLHQRAVKAERQLAEVSANHMVARIERDQAEEQEHGLAADVRILKAQLAEVSEARVCADKEAERLGSLVEAIWQQLLGLPEAPTGLEFLPRAIERFRGRMERELSDAKQQLREQLRVLIAAQQGVLEGFDTGVFVRDTSRDHDAGWAMRVVGPLAALARLQDARTQSACTPTSS